MLIKQDESFERDKLMEKRLKGYLWYLTNLSTKDMGELEKKRCIKELLTQISFFQHERLIHLIVTFFVGFLFLFLMTVTYFLPTTVLYIGDLLTLLLLLAYIRHYFILENGVQRMYTYYDKVTSGE